MAQFQYQSRTPSELGLGRFYLCTHHIIRELDFTHGPEGIYGYVMSNARSLYRCYLSCKNAFPTPDLKEELVKDVWNEACAREGAHSDVLLHDGEVASPFFHIWHEFTPIFSSCAPTWSSSLTLK